MTDTLIQDLANAVLQLNLALKKHGMKPATAISLPLDTGMKLKHWPRDNGMAFIARAEFSPKKPPCFVMTICDVDFEMDRT